MLVAQVGLERARAWEPAGWLGAFQFEEERRALTPTPSGRNRNRSAHEPNVASGIILRREGAAGFRPPQHTDYVGTGRGCSGGARRQILSSLRHEATID